MSSTEFVVLGVLTTVIGAVVLWHLTPSWHAMAHAAECKEAEAEKAKETATPVEDKTTLYNYNSPRWLVPPPLRMAPARSRQPIMVTTDQDVLPITRILQ